MIRPKRSKKNKVKVNPEQMQDEEAKAKLNLLSENWQNNEKNESNKNIFLENWVSNYEIQNEDYASQQMQFDRKVDKEDIKQFEKTKNRWTEKNKSDCNVQEDMRMPVITPKKQSIALQVVPMLFDKKQTNIKEKIYKDNLRRSILDYAEVNEVLMSKKRTNFRSFQKKSLSTNDYKVEISDDLLFGKSNMCFRSSKRKDNILINKICDNSAFKLAGKKMNRDDSFYSNSSKKEIQNNIKKNSEEATLFIHKQSELNSKIKERDILRKWNSNTVNIETNDFVKMIQDYKQNQNTKEITNKLRIEDKANTFSNTVNGGFYLNNIEKLQFSDDIGSCKKNDRERMKSYPEKKVQTDVSTQTNIIKNSKIEKKPSDTPYSKQLYNSKSNELLYNTDKKANNITRESFIRQLNKKSCENLDLQVRLVDNYRKEVATNNFDKNSQSTATNLELINSPNYYINNTSNCVAYEKINNNFCLKERIYSSNKLKNRPRVKNLSMNDNFEHMATEFLNSIPTPSKPDHYQANMFIKKDYHIEEKKFQEKQKFSTKLLPKLSVLNNDKNDSTIKNKESLLKKPQINERIDRLKYFDSRISDKIKTIKSKDNKLLTKYSFEDSRRLLSSPDNHLTLNEITTKISLKETITNGSEILNKHINNKAFLKNYLKKNSIGLYKNSCVELNENLRTASYDASNYENQNYKIEKNR